MRHTRVELTRRTLDLRRVAHAPYQPERTLKLPDPRRPMENDKTIRILIADDHDVVRHGLCALLALDPDLEVVGEAINGAQAVHFAHRLRPDVVLMDLAMPELDGIAATEVIHRELPNTSVVVLTSLLEDESIVRAVRAGAVGYLLKDIRAPDLRQANKLAVAGQTQISPKAAAQLAQKVVAAARPETLSEREAEVLQLLARGSANKQIGRDLGIGEKTVKTHVSSILGKLGVQSRTQAALYAARVGLVPLDQLGKAVTTGTAQSPESGLRLTTGGSAAFA